MLNLEIISLFSMKDKAIAQVALEYEKRLKPFAKLKLTEIKPSSFSESNSSKLKAQISDEKKLSKYFLSLQTKNIYLLSEEGSLYSSADLAKFFYYTEIKKMVLVIGNTLGFSQEFKQKYQLLSLSSLTFPHQLAKVLLLEQIYRSVCIYKGKDYHY